MFLSEALLWLAERGWLMFLHLSARSSFPKPLPPDEEKRLIDAMNAGDAEARLKLIEHNLRLAAHIAKKYVHSGVDQDDLVSIGSIGLIKAVNTFRADAGRLTTYASRCIENEILMYLRANRKNRNVLLMDGTVSDDGDGNELSLSNLIGTAPNAVADEVETAIESRRAVELMETVLDAREIRVLRMRYGLDGGESQPQHEIARELDISRSYVSRIEKRALEKLRAALERKPGDT